MYIEKCYPKKKIIYINGRFLTQPITGVQRYAIEVLKSFDRLLSKGIINKEEYSFVLLVPKNIRYNLDLECIALCKIGRLYGQIWEQLELPFFSKGCLLINLCNTAPLVKSQQILTIHDAAASANKNNYSFAFRTWYQLLHHLLPFRTKKIITVSNFSKKELMHYYPINEKNIKVVHLGVDHIYNLKRNNDILEKYDLLNKPYILAVSSLNPNKNFRGIIESLKYITQKDIQIVIVGADDIPIYKEANIQISSTIKLVGYVSDEELKSLYENAQCFIFPSFYEGFGLPPLEAMACGCPVIASDRASLPEVLGDTVIYCNPENPKDIAAKIEMLLGDKKLRSYYQEQGLKLSREYSWDNCGMELFNAIEEVLES